MGYSPANPAERGKWNKGLASLRACSATPTLIAERCATYRARFSPSIPLNPMSLAGNWTTLGLPFPGLEVSHHAKTSAATNGQLGGAAHDSRSASAAARPFPGVRVPQPRGGRFGPARAGQDPATVVGTPEYAAAYQRREAAYRHQWWPDEYDADGNRISDAPSNAQPAVG